MWLAIAALSWQRPRSQQIIMEPPVPHVPMPEGLASSPLAAALNPAINEEDIQAVMVNSEDDPDHPSEQDEDNRDEEKQDRVA